MSQINTVPYLFFSGTCREAMEYYKSIFGGELATTTRGSIDPSAPEDMKELLIHSELTGDVHIMASDNLDAEKPKSPQVAVSLAGQDEARMRKIFDALLEGGSTEHPMKTEFWGETFGDLDDKYGIRWLVTVTAPKKDADKTEA